MKELNFYKGESLNIIFSALDGDDPSKLIDISDYNKSVQVFTPYSNKISPIVRNINNHSFQIDISSAETLTLEEGHFNIVVQLSKNSEVKIGKSIPCVLLAPFKSTPSCPTTLRSNPKSNILQLDENTIYFNMYFGSNNNIVLDGASADLFVKKADLTPTLGDSLIKAPSEKAVKTVIDEVKKDLLGVTTNNKGIFSTLADLQSSFPQAGSKKDWYAFVGTTNPRKKYVIKADGGWWMDTLETHNVAEVDLSEYVKNKAIYNISQLHNKYDYANNQAARNVVPAVSRTVGQVIYYRLNTGKWVTEQYVGADVSGWAVAANWEKMGGLEEGDIGGIGYKTTSVETGNEFVNIVPKDSAIISGKFIEYTAGVVTDDARWAYCETYFPIEPNVAYLKNIVTLVNGYGVNPILYYDAGKKLIGSFGDKVDFTTPATAAFFRYNISTDIVGREFFVYKSPKIETTVSDTLSISIGVSDLKGAKTVEASSQLNNIIPKDIVMNKGALNSLGGVNANAWYHSDYIPVKGGVKYENNFERSAYVSHWFYDRDKRLIRVDGSTPSPINARFFRYSNSAFDQSAYYLREATAPKGVVIPELLVPRENIIETGVEISSYTAIGDSITVGSTYAQMLQKSMSIPELKIQSANGVAAVAMLGFVNTIANDYRGLVTIMLGTNDITGHTKQGDLDAVLAKPFESLVNGDSFCESFRLGLETLIRKAPLSKVMVLLPLKSIRPESNSEIYRELERKICSFLSIPYSELHRTCKISPVTFSLFMPDGVHPNSAGYAEIHRVLLPFVKMNI